MKPNNNNQYELHDSNQIERNNVGIISNITLSNMHRDIEDLQPNL